MKTVVRLEVSVDPEDPSRLALELAEAIASALQYADDGRAMAAQALCERGKAVAHVALAARVREYRSRPQTQRRRMDPMATYDLTTIDDEVEALRARADQLDKLAAEADRKADECRRKVPELQQRIKQAHAAIAAKGKVDGGP